MISTVTDSYSETFDSSGRYHFSLNIETLSHSWFYNQCLLIVKFITIGQMVESKQGVLDCFVVYSVL